MVDIKREDITLQDWTKGISADEFAWGSYYYSEWISSWYSTKWFELWYSTRKILLNKRNYSGEVVAMAPVGWYWFSMFTRDGKIEMEVSYNWDNKWAYYATYPEWWQPDAYINGLGYWNKLIWIRKHYVDIIQWNNLFSSTDLVSNPTFSGSTWWTVGAWWTIWDNWATHTSWTATLSTTPNWTPYTTSDLFRCSMKISWRTTWNLSVTLGYWTATFSAKTAGWYAVSLKWASTTVLTLTPTSTFNWTIEEIHIYKIDTTQINTATLYGWAYSPDYHPALLWEWDLYVATWNYVNIISLNDYWTTYKELVDANFHIVAMNQQAWNIIIWATDGHDSRQYYWNWVDGVATEVIEWKWLIIQCATWTETISYVLATSWKTSGTVDWYEYRLYAVSWYQRNLIASKLFQLWSNYYLETNHYNINKKFDFNDVTSDKGMAIFLDSLYIPWCDGVYKYWYDIPWLRSNWTRPIKYDTWAASIVMGQEWNYLGVCYRVGNNNYLCMVDNRLYNSTGYLISEAIYWDKLSTRKALEKLKIWYKNVASTVGNIKVYAMVDDTYFWRFRPTVTPTVRPSVWAVYNIANNTKWEVIDVDTTNWVITFRTIEDKGSILWFANQGLTKVSGDGDNTISVWYNFDNMCLIKTIESEQQGYGSDLIFWKDFVNTYLPYRYKIQFVIELNSNNNSLSPEIYEISMNSDITDVVL